MRFTAASLQERRCHRGSNEKSDGRRLVVVGSGRIGLPRIAWHGTRDLRGCCHGCAAAMVLRQLSGIVTASFEDFGLTPLEAASFGKPSAALQFGGFLDTIVEGVTGTLITEPDPAAINTAMDELSTTPFSVEKLLAHSQRFSEAQFTRRLREVVFKDPSRRGIGPYGSAD